MNSAIVGSAFKIVVIVDAVVEFRFKWAIVFVVLTLDLLCNLGITTDSMRTILRMNGVWKA